MNNQKEAFQHAHALTANADTLLKTEVFTEYFTGRVKELASKLAKDVLDSDNLSSEQREIKRHQRLILLDALKIPEQDIAFSREILRHNAPNDEDAISPSDM